MTDLFTGHTELIGALCGVQDVTIMLASPDLIVTHVSTHVSLLNAIRNAKRARIQTIIQLTAHARYSGTTGESVVTSIVKGVDVPT